MLQIYNIATRKKEAFEPAHKGKAHIYSCGPTVYNMPHIGNWRSFIFSDLLARYLKWSKIQVSLAQNITDVDDKTIKGAHKEGVNLKAFTQRYADIFFMDAKKLNIMPAQYYPRATDFIPEMLELIQKLEKKGYAYKASDGSVYFSVSKFKDYGKLAHLDMKGLKAGARVQQDEYQKETANDFALWKAYTPEDGEVYWESPYGKGRPGWHIECSAMSLKLLGEVDIHTGGIDLLFPHHQNEAAQSEAATGKPFAKYWMHCEHLLVDGKKMAKSLGNFYTLEDLLAKGYSAMAIRYLLLSTHYRQQLNFTTEGLDGAKNTLEKLNDFIRRTKAKAGEGKERDAVHQAINSAKKEFTAAMDDDLATSEALAVVHEFMGKINTMENELTPGDCSAVVQFMGSINDVLGVLSFDDEEMPPEIRAIIDEREAARKKKDYSEADRLRKKLTSLGIHIDDTKDGTMWKRMK